ncbi:MAG: sigma-54-dependent transcriptional regulator [Desulfatibacillaceae bacterium]
MNASAIPVLVVDDELAMRESLAAWLKRAGYAAATAKDGEAALAEMKNRTYRLVLLDLKMPGMDGHEVLRRIKAEHPHTTVVVITAYGSIESAVLAMKQGAADYLIKPCDPEQLMHLVDRLSEREEARDAWELREQERAVCDCSWPGEIVGASEAMRGVFDTVKEVAPTEAAVMVTGETGTGKELVARAIHNCSPRCGGPFVAVNCGALPEHLLETELFGHERGAFTGAVGTRLGRVEMADRGTLFLDEVGEMPLRMQVDLLRVLDKGSFMRVGGQEEVESDFRLVCATHRDLERQVEGGHMRSDFFYRVNVVSVAVPPLRERPEDIGILANRFMARFCREIGRSVEGFSREAVEALRGYSWPGNVRELRNVVERAVVLCGCGRVECSHLSFACGREEAPPPGASLEEVEARHVERVLRKCGWNITRAANMLGVDRGTVSRRMKKFGLEKPA